MYEYNHVEGSVCTFVLRSTASGDGARRKNMPRVSGVIETLPELMHVVGGRYDVIGAFLGEELSRDEINDVSVII